MLLPGGNEDRIFAKIQERELSSAVTELGNLTQFNKDFMLATCFLLGLNSLGDNIRHRKEAPCSTKKQSPNTDPKRLMRKSHSLF